MTNQESVRITALYTYPIKSCAGISHTTVQLEARGPLHDRRWMVVEDDGSDPAMFLTQRELPRLALVQPSLVGDQLVINAPGMPETAVPLAQSAGRRMNVQVWEDACQAIDAGDELAAWFSAYLGVQTRLVRMDDDFVRPVDLRYSREPALVGFTDGYPLLVISESSLEELNRRMEARGKASLPMNRFRPNVVVAGCAPFAEDTWHRIVIGDMPLDVVKPCARCVTTTVDQSRGLVPDKAEPLATLATFRRNEKGGVLFGQNVIHRANGRLAVGDAVNVMELAP